MSLLVIIVAIHQPNYLPWLGFFYKLARSEAFIFLDTVPFSKNSYQNRCRLKTANGLLWLTQPVCTSGRSGQATADVEFDSTLQWQKKHLKSIEMAYRRAPFFKQLFPKLESVLLAHSWQHLADLNIALIESISFELGCATRFFRALHLGVRGHATDLLVGLCKRIQATVYLSGTGGKKYQDINQFAANGIQVTYTDFTHPQYKQLWGQPVVGLSIIDLLMNHGPESRTILLGGADQARTGLINTSAGAEGD